MKLTAESTVINDGKINTNIDNAQTTADNAQTTATEAKTIADNTAQNFWFKSEGTDTGAHITEVSQAEFEASPSGGNLLARSNGIAIRKGLAEVATFAEGEIVLGSTGKGRATITDSSLRFLPNYGAADFNYARQSDVQVEQTFIGDGVTVFFDKFRHTDGTLVVTINGTQTTDFGTGGGARDDSLESLRFNTAPASGAVIVIAYTTSWTNPYYSFGKNEVTAPYGYAEGHSNEVNGIFAHAEGRLNTANGPYAHAQNHGTRASSEAQTAIGKYNVEDTEGQYALLIGNGKGTARSNAMTVAWNGNTTIAGTLTQSSDRRLKEHIDYLSDDADEFIRELKPAHYIKDGDHHTGFYAQDVEAVDKWGGMVGEMNGYKTLGYEDLIAPLVAYCQHLEKRIEALERTIK